MKKFNCSLCVFLWLCMSPSAFGHDKGDVLLRIGLALLEPSDESDPLFISAPSVGLNQLSLDSFLGTKTGVGVDGKLVLGGSLSYVFTPHWGIETLVGIPTGIQITAQGLTVLGIEKVGKVKLLPIVASVQYYPELSLSQLQPYFGFGAYYTYFDEIELDKTIETVFGFDSEKFKLENSFGYTLNAGLDWQLGGNWFANMSLYYFKIDVDVEAGIYQSSALALAAGSATPVSGSLNTRLKADVQIYFLTVGYRF